MDGCIVGFPMYKKKKKYTAFNHASTHNTTLVGLLTSMNETRGSHPFLPLFSIAFSNTKTAKNLKKFKVLFLHARVRIRVIFLYRAETPCRTLGIKIIITLEIGHGTPRNLRWPYAGWNEARRTWKKEKERRRGEEEKKRIRSHT